MEVFPLLLASATSAVTAIICSDTEQSSFSIDVDSTASKFDLRGTETDSDAASVSHEGVYILFIDIDMIGVDHANTDSSVSPDFYTENGKYIQGVSLPVGVEGTWDGNHVYHFGSQRKVGNIELEIYGDDALFIDQAGFDHYDGNNYTPPTTLRHVAMTINMDIVCQLTGTMQSVGGQKYQEEENTDGFA